jgi:L-seryl-tRNA(Ser) seleniumtransferase
LEDPRRRVPRMDIVLADIRLADAQQRFGRARLRTLAEAQLDRVRAGQVGADSVVDEVLAALPVTGSSLRPVINATGVLVHTNLGRAPLSALAIDAITEAAGPTNVELNLATGQRGPRGERALAALAAAVPGAGAVHVVNNGAAALGLSAAALAGGRRVIVARGELVEIGDGFRIPELVESFGAELVEVGTTNRVRIEDYAQAIDDNVAFVLKVHPSNFRIEGFTSSVTVAELAQLPAPVVADLGSGLLAPHPRLPDEPDAATALADGAALVTASGDKLLGGPQCGLLLGRADLVTRLRRHPMARALRVDKLTLAALEATLTGPPPPVRAALDEPVERLRERAERIAARLGKPASAVPSVGRVGGGGAPGVEVPSAAVALPEHLTGSLRLGDDPVVGHVHGGRLLLDLLAVPAHDDDRLTATVRRVLTAG